MTEGPTLQDLRNHMWVSGDLEWKLDGLQRKIRSTVNASTASKICIMSSRQIGKSFWSCVHALEFLAKNKRRIARIVAPTLKQCNDIVQDNLSGLILDAPQGFIASKKSDYRWELFNGSSLRLGALERAHVDGNRGGNASLVIYEECGFVRGDDFSYGVNSVLGPQLLRSKGREIFVSSPSEDPDHPLHTRVLPECKSLGTAFVYTVYDSPSITREMIEEAARRCGGYESEAFQREYLARIIRPATYMVVPGYDEARHVTVFDPPTECFWQVAIDWGGVRDLTVAILHTYDFLSNRELIWDELVWTANTPTSTIVEGLKAWETSYLVRTRWADVPGQLQVDLADGGYEVQLPQKSDWLATVNAMSVKFSTDRVHIHPRCEFLRKSLRAGMLNRTRSDFERSPELGHCDALAALMYGIRSMDRSNPFQHGESRPRDNMFYREAAAEKLDLGTALNPVRFGRFK